MGRFLLAAVCGALVVQAQVPAPKKTRMEGRVVGLNGEAVRKATVRLQRSGHPGAGHSRHGPFATLCGPPGIHSQ